MSNEPQERSNDRGTTDAVETEAPPEPETDGTDGDEPEAGGTDGDETEAATDRSYDHIFDALRNRRRRDVLEYLLAHDGSATIGEIAEDIAAFENDTTVQGISASQRKRVYVGLYQCHLPKLDDYGFVAYDQDRGDVTLGPKAAQLYPYMPGHETASRRSWPHVYLGYGLVSLAVVAGATTLGVTTGIGGTLLTVAVAAGVCALALGHLLEQRA